MDSSVENVGVVVDHKLSMSSLSHLKKDKRHIGIYK